MVSGDGGEAETKLLGRALRELRRRAGMTLAEAGDAVAPKPMSGQAWGLWEQGQRPGLHNPASQDRLLRAVQADRADLARELARLRGAAEPDTETPTSEPAAPARAAERGFTVPVLSRARHDAAAGRLVYDPRHADASADLAWLFGPTAGHLRMADDRLKGRVEAGQLIHYDRALPPAPGQVCVVDAEDGLHVYEYGQLSGAVLTVRQANPPAEVEFDMAKVRGVYAVRLVGG
jgi:hypothetical protein